MLATELRDHLYKEMCKGRRPQVVLVTQKDYTDLIQDLTGKRDVFEPLIFQGVMIVTAEMVLMLNPDIYTRS